MNMSEFDFPVEKAVNVYSIASIFEAEYSDKFYFPGELHPFWELVFVIEGNVCVSADNAIYELKKNDIIFHKPMEFHRLWLEDDNKCHLFIMSFYAQGKMMHKLENMLTNINGGNVSLILSLLEYLRNYSGCESYGFNKFYETQKSDSFMQYIANSAVNLLISISSEKSIVDAREYRNSNSDIYKKILRIMNDNINSDISVAEIAKECAISTSSLKTAFAEISDVGIHKYFLKLKMSVASYYLRSRNTVAETSEKLGISSPDYFSYAFKRELGMTPTEFVRKINGQR